MKKTLFAALILCAVFFAGCYPFITTHDARQHIEHYIRQPATGNVFRWATAGVDRTLNPHEAITSADFGNIDLVLASLYGWVPSECRERSVLVPRIAAGEPVSEDGITWIISVNPEARWANGSPITAHTFIYSWRMGLDPALSFINATFIANRHVEIKNAVAYYRQNPHDMRVTWDMVGMRALDDYTLEIITMRPETAMGVMLHFSQRATGPVYEPLFEAGMNSRRTTTLYGTSLEFFMGNGPFTLTAWAPGLEGLARRFVRNENYINAHMIHLDGIHVSVNQVPQSRLFMFQSGQSDFTIISPDAAETYADDNRLMPYDRLIVRTIEVNQNNPDLPILADPLFRRALYFATDRSTVARLTKGIPAPYFLSTLGISFSDGTRFREMPEANAWLPPNYGYDPDRARAYMAEALARHGLDSISLTLIYCPSFPALRPASAFIQSHWENLFGEDVFSLSLHYVPHLSALALMRTSVSGPTADWDLSWSGWNVASEIFQPHAKFAHYQSSAPNRFTNYSNAFLDEHFPLFDEDEFRLDERRRFELTVEIERHLVLEDVTAIPVFQERGHAIFSDRISLPVDAFTPALGFGWSFSKILAR